MIEESNCIKKRWKKLGNLYDPRLSNFHKMQFSHASNPVPIHLESNIFRIFFNIRDKKNRSSIAAVDIDIIKKKIIYEHQGIFFKYGSEDSFFSHGVSLGNFYDVDNSRYMLFMGWKMMPDKYWQGRIGRLLIDGNSNISLDKKQPILDINSIDMISLSYPWILFTNSFYQIWYGSTLSWKKDNGEMLHVINYASSNDGNIWKRHGQVIPHKLGVAQAFSRPSVIICNETYHMWFSYRGNKNDKYKIGYATSEDALNWILRLDHKNICTSECGWDSEMIEYPYVFLHNDELYMLYNGNDYGRTGFGLAKYE